MPEPAQFTGKPFTGLTAKVQLGTDILGYISGCTLNVSKDIIEILAFGMEYKEKVPAIKDWSLSVDGTAAFAKSNSQEALWKAFEGREAVEISLFLDDTTKFVGKGYVASLDIEAAPDDKISISAEISGSNAVTATFAAGAGVGA